jgi:hypothetical protein
MAYVGSQQIEEIERQLVRRGNLGGTGGGGPVAWNDVTGKPSTFPPSTHGHVIADVIGLQTALDGKQAAGSYAPAVHSHVIGDVTGLQAALDGKQPLAAVLTGTTASFTTAQETKLAGIAAGAQVNVPTDLAYTASTRLLASSTGTDVNLPLVTSGEAGLAPASGGGTTNFLRADGTWAAPPAGGGSVTILGYQQMAPAVGEFIGNGMNATALGTQAQVANRTVIAPYISAYALTIDQVGISCSTLLAASSVKVVIYDADANGRPTTILRESATISTAATGTFFVAITSFTFTAGKKYWIGVRSSGTQTLRTLGVGATGAVTYTNAATPLIESALILTETYANAAANWTYAAAQHSNALVPLVLMRVA